MKRCGWWYSRDTAAHPRPRSYLQRHDSSPISCATLSLGIITYLDLTTMPAYLNLTMTSLLVTGYIVPNITAFWLGHPIHNIMVASQNRSIFVTVLSERITVTFTEPRR